MNSLFTNLSNDFYFYDTRDHQKRLEQHGFHYNELTHLKIKNPDILKEQTAQEKLQQIFNRSVWALTEQESNKVSTLYKELRPEFHPLFAKSLEARHAIALPETDELFSRCGSDLDAKLQGECKKIYDRIIRKEIDAEELHHYRLSKIPQFSNGLDAWNKLSCMFMHGCDAAYIQKTQKNIKERQDSRNTQMIVLDNALERFDELVAKFDPEKVSADDINKLIATTILKSFLPLDFFKEVTSVIHSSLTSLSSTESDIAVDEKFFIELSKQFLEKMTLSIRESNKEIQEGLKLQNATRQILQERKEYDHGDFSFIPDAETRHCLQKLFNRIEEKKVWHLSDKDDDEDSYQNDPAIKAIVAEFAKGSEIVKSMKTYAPDTAKDDISSALDTLCQTHRMDWKECTAVYITALSSVKNIGIFAKMDLETGVPLTPLSLETLS